MLAEPKGTQRKQQDVAFDVNIDNEKLESSVRQVKLYES
jgi:hypothetical protein